VQVRTVAATAKAMEAAKVTATATAGTGSWVCPAGMRSAGARFAEVGLHGLG